MKRRFYYITGILAVGLGIIGVVLPGFPTTPFLLLASWCFMRSSPRLNQWLYATRYLGGYLRRFHGDEPQTIWDKLIPLFTTWIAISISITLIADPLLKGVLFLAGCTASFSILFAKRILIHMRERHNRNEIDP